MNKIKHSSNQQWDSGSTGAHLVHPDSPQSYTGSTHPSWSQIVYAQAAFWGLLGGKEHLSLTGEGLGEESCTQES